MDSPAQQIKERLPIEEIISSYLKLIPAGRNFKAKCPFHNEKTPSFFVSPERNSYYCFGCGAKGDIFTFVEEFEGLDFRGALKLLAERAGVTLAPYNQKTADEKERLYQAVAEAAKYFEQNLNPDVLKYLESRGLEEKTIRDFRIGFALDDWRGLYQHLKSKFTDRELELSGLIKKIEGKTGYYDRFRKRIIFPITDSSGRVIAFSGRIFGEGEPKYLNSPDTPIFSKQLVLYGLDRAKESIRKNNFSILVEGQMDLVLSHQAGFRNTVATSGTALSDPATMTENVISNLGLVRRLSENIVLAFDADKAGLRAAERAGRIALSLSMDVKVAALPPDIDPADLIARSGADAWREAIRNSKHLILFMLDKAGDIAQGDGRKMVRLIREKVLPYVGALQSSVEQAYFLQKISDFSGTPATALKEDLEKIPISSAERAEIQNIPAEDSPPYRKDNILRRLLGIILWQRDLAESEIDLEKILKELEEILNRSSVDILRDAADSGEDWIFEAEVLYGAGDSLGRDVQELLYNLKEEYLKEVLFKKAGELEKAERERAPERSRMILEEINVINKEIEEIANKRLNHK